MYYYNEKLNIYILSDRHDEIDMTFQFHTKINDQCKKMSDGQRAGCLWIYKKK